MTREPVLKRTVAFVDGQNLFHAARKAFGYTYPNFDVAALCAAVCAAQGWQPQGTRFYTGVPAAKDDERWHRFWNAKLAAMGRQGVVVFSRPLRYRERTVNLPDGSQHAVVVGEEKGIDVRLALDVIAGAHRREFDVGLILSQDQDLSEVAREIPDDRARAEPLDQAGERVPAGAGHIEPAGD